MDVEQGRSESRLRRAEPVQQGSESAPESTSTVTPRGAGVSSVQRVVGESSKQRDDGQDPIGDDAEGQGDVCLPVPVDGVFANDSAAFFVFKKLDRAVTGSVSKSSSTTHTFGLEGEELVSRRPRVLRIHAAHLAFVQVLGDCTVVNGTKGLGTVHDAINANLAHFEPVEILAKYTCQEGGCCQEAGH